jgi:hypothetical protein
MAVCVTVLLFIGDIRFHVGKNVDYVLMDYDATQFNTALIQFKYRKAPGSGEINIQLLKQAPPPHTIIRLLDLINMCWRTGYAPEEWNIAVFTPIHKKGSINNCSNYGGISLLNYFYKIY